MKILKPLFFSFLVVAFGCTGANNTTDTSNDATEETAEAVKEETPAPAPVKIEGENFTITVVEGGIASPRKELKATVGEATITINYGSPSVKGREIWGGLEPYDEVWRTGANKATSFEVDKDITVNGETLPAGKYGFFTIPGKEEWVVIFNKNFDQWGDGQYSEGEDVLRVTVRPQVLENVKEEMDFILDGDMLALQWEKVSVPFQVAM